MTGAGREMDLDVSHWPRPNAGRLAVSVTKDALRQIRGGHPWVFDGSILSVRGLGAAGDLAVIFDDERNFAAIGLYDPSSPIRVRILHHGRPVAIDENWFGARIDDAVARRALVNGADHDGVATERTTGYRVIHGENDALPGLVLDRYGATFVLKLYTAAWIPHLATIARLLVERLAPERVVLRLSRSVHSEVKALSDGAVLFGSVPDGPVVFTENGLRFEADVVRGQKTGHFSDQRDNRALVRSLASGARVLDVFAFTGGFSVHAAAGGAATVHSVDADRHAVAATTRNMAHNGDDRSVRATRHECTVGDAFDVLRDLSIAGARYDIVVLDPPSFAAKQSDVAGALRAYGTLTRLGLRLLEPGGVLVQSSCSSRVTTDAFFENILRSAGAHGVHLDQIARTGHGVDHPIGFAHGAYLKTLFARRRPDGGGSHPGDLFSHR